MSTDTPAAAPTAEREAFEAAMREEGMSDRELDRNEHGKYVDLTTGWAYAAWQVRAALSAPVAAQPAASGVDALWVERLRETAMHLRGNSLSLAKYPGMGNEARARELAALYIGEIAEMYAARTHLSTALTGAAKEETNG